MMAQPVQPSAGYGGGGYSGGGYSNGPQPGYGGPTISSGTHGQLRGRVTTQVHIQSRGNRKRLSQEGWCWVVLLLLLCWPLCWLPFVMDQCYEYY